MEQTVDRRQVGRLYHETPRDLLIVSSSSAADCDNYFRYAGSALGFGRTVWYTDRWKRYGWRNVERRKFRIGGTGS